MKRLLLSASYRLKLPKRLIYRDDFAIVPAPLQADWAQIQFVKRFLARLKPDCVLDVGANFGQFGQDLRSMGYKGLILSFEPDPACFEALSGTLSRDGKWHAFNLALGASPGTAEFNIMDVPAFNSFRVPTTSDTDRYAHMNQVVKTIPVEIDTLERLLPELQERYGFARPYLKMDTQGYDLEVFRGARGVHNRLIALQSEVSVKKIYENVPRWTEVIAEYEAAGFELAGLFAVNANTPELVEFDCHMVRKGADPAEEG